MIRQLRGLRAQLLLWTIAPVAVALVVFSVFGVTRHRAAMAQLVEDRNRGMVLAEANRLARDIQTRSALLAGAAAESGIIADVAALGRLARELSGSFPAGLALMNGSGALVAPSPGGSEWSGADEARILATRTAATGRPEFETLVPGSGRNLLLVGVAVGEGRVLAGAIPVDELNATNSWQILQGEGQGGAQLLDATGRLISSTGPAEPHWYGPHDLPVPSPGEVGAARLPVEGHEVLVTYAAVDPPGWTLSIAEDVHDPGSMGLSIVEVLPLALLAVALVALLALSFGVVNVVRPLQELDRRAQRVAWGDFDAVKQPVGGVQEMDDLRQTLAQMAERIRSYQAGMRDYLSAVTNAQEAERERLAHELHDDTVQALIALRQRAQSARKALAGDPGRADQRLQELTELIDGELANLRRLIGDLRPIYLEDLGFVPALEMLVKQTEARGQAVTLTVEGEVVRLAPDLELAAFRIVQQALANVVAHAAAPSAAVRVVFEPADAGGNLQLVVSDGGRGFVPPEQPADLTRDGHFGLMGMRERALLYGGRLTIDSAPGRGTTVTVRLPCR